MSDTDEDSFNEKSNNRRKNQRTGSEDRANLRQRIAEKVADYEKLYDEFTELQAKSKRKERKMQRELSEHKVELEELSEELKIEKKSCSKYRSLNKQLEKKILEQDEEIERLSVDIKTKEKKIDEGMKLKEQERLKIEEEHKRKTNVLESEIDTLKEANRTLELEIKDVNDKSMTTRQVAVDKLKRKIDECRTDIESKNQEILNLNDKLEESRKLCNAEIEKNDQLNAMLKNQQFSLEDFKMKIQTLERELDKPRKNLSLPIRAEERHDISPLSSRLRSTSLVMEERKEVLTSDVVDGVTEVCPNCNNVFAIDRIEAHLESCLDDY